MQRSEEEMVRSDCVEDEGQGVELVVVQVVVQASYRWSDNSGPEMVEGSGIWQLEKMKMMDLKT